MHETFSVPEAPDFIATGDFDADGHWDIVTGHRGGSALYLLRGDGHGAFHAAKTISLGGSLTALIADLIVAVKTAAGAQVQVNRPLARLRLSPSCSCLRRPCRRWHWAVLMRAQ